MKLVLCLTLLSLSLQSQQLIDSYQSQGQAPHTVIKKYQCTYPTKYYIDIMAFSQPDEMLVLTSSFDTLRLSLGLGISNQFIDLQKGQVPTTLENAPEDYTYKPENGYPTMGSGRIRFTTEDSIVTIIARVNETSDLWYSFYRIPDTTLQVRCSKGQALINNDIVVYIDSSIQTVITNVILPTCPNMSDGSILFSNGEILTNLSKGQVSHTISNQYCNKEFNVILQSKYPICNLFVPNIFTNNELIVYTDVDYQINIEIYDRWGNLRMKELINTNQSIPSHLQAGVYVMKIVELGWVGCFTVFE